MKITREEVIHVARLARLDIDDASVGKFADQIGEILDYVDALNRVNTENVTPTAHAISLTNAFREDVETEPLDTGTALANAPEKDDQSFVVPRIID